MKKTAYRRIITTTDEKERLYGCIKRKKIVTKNAVKESSDWLILK